MNEKNKISNDDILNFSRNEKVRNRLWIQFALKAMERGPIGDVGNFCSIVSDIADGMVMKWEDRSEREEILDALCSLDTNTLDVLWEVYHHKNEVCERPKDEAYDALLEKRLVHGKSVCSENKAMASWEITERGEEVIECCIRMIYKCETFLREKSEI